MRATTLRENDSRVLLRTLVTLAIPTILEELLRVLLQYVDTAMVGRLGEQATAAVSTTTTVTWLVNSVPGAAATAVLALVSRAVGSGDREAASRTAQQALLLTVLCGVVCGGVSIALSPWIPVWMGAEETIRGQASLYFFIISLPMLFRAASTILGAAIRATQNTRTPMFISLAANALNAALNYLCIYVLRLGVTGAAIASAVSYALSGVLMYGCFRRSPLLCWRWREFRPDGGILKKCAHIGLPVLGTGLTSCFGYVAFAALVSGMGTTVFAAHSLAVTAETMFYLPGYGLRTATSAMTGEALGRGDGERLRRLSWLSTVLTVGMMCLSGVVLYCAAGLLMRLFTPSVEAAALGAQMLRMVAFSEPFFGLMIVLEGILYGLGRTRYPFFVETAGMWAVRILFTALCVRVWHLGLRAVWVCMIADNVTKALMLAVPFVLPKRRAALLSIPLEEAA